jgi:hypothetical protein
MNTAVHTFAIAVALWALLHSLNTRRTLHKLQHTVRDMLKLLNGEQK